MLFSSECEILQNTFTEIELRMFHANNDLTYTDRGSVCCAAEASIDVHSRDSPGVMVISKTSLLLCCIMSLSPFPSPFRRSSVAPRHVFVPFTPVLI